MGKRSALIRVLLVGLVVAVSSEEAQAPARGAMLRPSQSRPFLDLAGLTAEERSTVEELLQAAKCRCGCDLNLAVCASLDPLCPSWPKMTQVLLDGVRAGLRGQELVTMVRAASPLPDPGDTTPPELDPAQAVPDDGAPFLGPAQAPVTLVVFLDYTGAPSRSAHLWLKTLRQAFGQRLRVVHRSVAAPASESALLAAEAVLAAHAQGKLTPMQDALFAQPQEWSCEQLAALACDLNLDLDAFRESLEQHRFRPDVEHDWELGLRAGVEQAPALFINGRRYRGSLDVATLRPFVERAGLEAPPAAAAVCRPEPAAYDRKE